MSTPRPCLICAAPAHYAHNGVDSCRSCSDFYKRTVVAHRVFQCRTGDGKCTIKPKDRHNCRGCRFAKCTSLGMKYADPRELRALAATQNEPLLALIAKEHERSIERRRERELAMHPTGLHRQVRADIEGEDFLLCTWTFMMDCCKKGTGEYIDFASTCFPEFAALSSADQQLMLTAFAVRLFNAEILCDSFRRFGSLDGHFAMATITTCYDIRMYEFVTEQESPEMSKAISKSLLHYQLRIRRLVGPILKQSQFTDTEMAASFALTIWWIDPAQNLPEHIASVARRARLRLFEALRAYYENELCLGHYSVRLGNLVTFQHTIQEIPNLLAELIQMLSVTGTLSDESAFLEAFMNMSL